MKLAILHLSDAHIEDDTYFSSNILDAQIQSLNEFAPFDCCWVFFSGDLAFSGRINEYERVKLFLGTLWKKIKEKFNIRIRTFVVPGNHDIFYNNEKRTRDEVCEIIQNDITDEVITNELNKFDNFYSFAKYYKCFLKNKIVDNIFIKENGLLFQVNLINSELFSTCASGIKNDDKGLHYLPLSECERLKKGNNVDFVISVAHRGTEWFDWKSSNDFKRELYYGTDIFLYGHEHIDNLQNVCIKANHIINSIATGIDFKNQEVKYSLLSLDTDKNMVQSKLFSWNKSNRLFIESFKDDFIVDKKNDVQYTLSPNIDFTNDFLVDENKQDISNYFVFSGVEIADGDKTKEIKDFDELLTEIISTEHCIIEGDDSSGKTFLLKELYMSFMNKYVVLYLNEETLCNRAENTIKAAFNNQYSSDPIEYQKFLQIDRENKIVLVDDLNKIKPKYIKILQDVLVKNFAHVVSISDIKWNINLVEMVKEGIENKSVIKMKLLPFYAKKRIQLIKNLIKLYKYDSTDIEKEANLINGFIRDQIKLFTLSPRFINLYVRFCIRDNEGTSNNKNAFGRVFENNIINNLRKYSSENDIDEYFVLLQEIAYEIHFKEKYPILSSELSLIVENYNTQYALKVSTQKFCEAMLNSKIFKEEDNAFYFYNNNYLAYFVAKSLNSKYNNGEDNGELANIAKNICFNINGDILLFLSYITTNLSILKFIRLQAEEHMSEWNEFSIDGKNLGFIVNSICPQIKTLPNKQEIREKDEREEKFEKAITREDKIEKIKLYEYDREDINREDYKIAKAIRFTELVCKILPGFNHVIKKDEKTNISKDIYSFPNKIIFKVLHDIDENYEEIIKELVDYFKNEKKDVDEKRIKEWIIVIAEVYILNIYDECARLSVTDRTIDILNSFDNNNTNYKIQHIMMLENLGNFNAFTDEANKLFDNSNLSIVQSMVRRIVRKHYLYNKNLRIVGKVESVAKKYFGESFKKVDLLK